MTPMSALIGNLVCRWCQILRNWSDCTSNWKHLTMDSTARIEFLRKTETWETFLARSGQDDLYVVPVTVAHAPSSLSIVIMLTISKIPLQSILWWWEQWNIYAVVPIIRLFSLWLIFEWKQQICIWLKQSNENIRPHVVYGIYLSQLTRHLIVNF
jgi:hypothetical protein